MESDTQKSSAKSYYQYCIVPKCTNTSVSTPEKLFIRLPSDAIKRANWVKACSRNPKDIALSSRVYICQDHFNLQEDMENYIKYSLVGGKIKIKENVVPHLFDC